MRKIDTTHVRYSNLKAEHIGGTIVQFTCPQGHIWREDYSKKRPGQRMSEFGVRLMAKWWSNDRGVSGHCPKCLRRDVKK